MLWEEEEALYRTQSICLAMDMAVFPAVRRDLQADPAKPVVIAPDHRGTLLLDIPRDCFRQVPPNALSVSRARVRPAFSRRCRPAISTRTTGSPSPCTPRRRSATSPSRHRRTNNSPPQTCPPCNAPTRSDRVEATMKTTTTTMTTRASATARSRMASRAGRTGARAAEDVGKFGR